MSEEKKETSAASASHAQQTPASPWKEPKKEPGAEDGEAAAPRTPTATIAAAANTSGSPFQRRDSGKSPEAASPVKTGPFSRRNSSSSGEPGTPKITSRRQSILDTEVVVHRRSSGDIVVRSRAASDAMDHNQPDLSEFQTRHRSPSQIKADQEKVKRLMEATRPSSYLILSVAVALISVLALVVPWHDFVFAGLQQEPAVVTEWRSQGYILNLNESGVEADIFIARFGPLEAKTKMVILHDAFTSSIFFRNAMQTLELFGTHVVLFDFPGFGLSTTPMRHNHKEVIDMQAVWLEEVLDSLDMSGVSLVAQGTAASAACAYAVKYPERVSSLIVFGDTLEPRRRRLPTGNELTTNLQQWLYPLAYHHECSHDGLAEATTFMALLHGRAAFTHHMRHALISHNISCAGLSSDIRQLWLAHSNGLLVDSATPIPSSSICIPHDRPRDFLLSVMSFVDPQVTTVRFYCSFPRFLGSFCLQIVRSV